MTRDHLHDGAITTAEDFRDVLAEAIEKAIIEDIDVRGSWECQTADSTHNWEVSIFELAKDFTDDE